MIDDMIRDRQAGNIGSGVPFLRGKNEGAKEDRGQRNLGRRMRGDCRM